MTHTYDLIELYNENTGEYRHIYAATVTSEENNRYIYGGWGNQPIAVVPSNPTVILFDENGEKIGNILYCNNTDWGKGPMVEINEEIWVVTKANDHIFYTPEVPKEEHT